MLYAITPEHMRHANSVQRQRMCEWARANGLEPNDICAGDPVEVVDLVGRVVIHCWEYERNAAGQMFLRDGDVAKRRRSARLVAHYEHAE